MGNADPLTAVDDLQGLVLGLALWLAILIAAPVVVLVLAAGLLSVELPIVGPDVGAPCLACLRAARERLHGPPRGR
jgi:hypothetical protein